MENIDDSEKFETYVRFVYDALLNLHGEGVQVGHKTMVRGRSGSWYELDVYYQFVRAGITHQVAFECKNWKRAVDRDSVLAFHGKLADIGNINGVMVSRVGFSVALGSSLPTPALTSAPWKTCRHFATRLRCGSLRFACPTR